MFYSRLLGTGKGVGSPFLSEGVSGYTQLGLYFPMSLSQRRP